MSDQRETAVLTLEKILKEKIFFSEIKSDSPFINMLILTSLRHLVHIKKSLKQFIKKNLPEKASFANYAIILASTEIIYLDSPDYAIINSYVDTIKKHTDKYIAGFANAVLRNVAKNAETIKSSDKGEFFPPEFSRILNLNYNKSTISKIEKAAILEPPLDISIKENFDIEGLKLDSETIRLSHKGKVSDIKGYAEGLWWVQDYAASLAIKTLDKIKGKKVLDLCAAPGGKTAQLINKGAIVTALDISKPRLETLESNLSRLGFKTQEIINQDALEYLQSLSSPVFDIIILDAPCSATGTLRRHPEVVHLKTIDDIKKQSLLQQEILDNISKALKPNGTLVYCVCSISKLEGENQIDSFLEKNKNFKIIPIESKRSEFITEKGYIRTLPHHLSKSGGMDSFFIAKLIKEQ